MVGPSSQLRHRFLGQLCIFLVLVQVLPRLKHPNKHIPPSNISYLIVLLKFNFWVAYQPTMLPSGIISVFLDFTRCTRDLTKEVKRYFRAQVQPIELRALHCVYRMPIRHASRENRPLGLCRCHTKRRIGARGRAHPSFGMTPTFREYDL